MSLKRSMIQACLAIVLGGWMLLGVVLPAGAVPIQQIPNPRQTDGGWVTDMAQLLNPETKRTLNQMISRLEQQNGTEIAVVTVTDTTPATTPKQFATALFNDWGIGKRGQDNGVLLLISRDDRRVEIETGYGIEPILSNQQVGKIIQHEILPHFKYGNFSAGVLSGTWALVTALEHPVVSPARSAHLSGQRTYQANLTGLFWVLAALGFGLVGIVGRSLVFFRPTFVPPEGRSRSRLGRDHAIHCQDCRQPMTALPPETVLEYLSRSEQVAQTLGSIRVDGWQCPICHSQLSGLGLHLRTQVLDDYHVCLCPTCEELTVEQTSELLQPATLQVPGLQRRVEQCRCCGDRHEWEETVPYQAPSTYSDSYWGDSGSGGGGGDFGGGSSCLLYTS
ncbi:TPM domain-containing protein, partial [Pantanalinema rosaneae CENA516]|uniref:TPM domain-containing protein n=1 Tax=Pantanalinema rosaneae TaxID=1620701 RepID=UPI003D6ECC4D